jgi:N-acetylmuramoyl-L-alanine amidase
MGIAGLSALLLAGCASRDTARAPDWPSEPAAEPVLADVATNAPPAPAPPPPVAAAPVPVVPPPPAKSPAPPRPTTTWVPLNQWCLAIGCDKPSPVALDSFPAFALNTTNGTFVLRTGSPMAQWNGFEIRLAYAPQLMGEQPFVHSLDLAKTVEPLISGAPILTFSNQPTVVIDPGHGGDDAGTRSAAGNGYERDFTLDWAKRLGALLSDRGWRVYLTRTNDVHLSLSNRVAIADQHNASLFLSLHFNSAGANDRQAGLETYCLTPPGMYSSVTREFADDPKSKFPNNAFDAQNLQLAFRVHRALLLASGYRDRGVRRARYLSVLRGQNRPAILIEGGFLSNPQEARRIGDPAYRQRLAEGVAKALLELPELAAPPYQTARAKPELSAQRSEANPQNPSTP